MSRYFMIQSWVGSHENEPEYNGQQAGERNVRSSEVVPLYDRWGNANVLAFSDEAIAARNNANKPTSKVNIKDKILPQLRRLNTLRAQMVDLEVEYKTTNMTCTEYSMLRDVIMAKIQRAEVLYRKAISVRPTSYENEEENIDSSEEISYTINDHHSPSAPVASDIGVRFIDDLSHSNSLKKPLKIACTLVRKALEYKNKISSYINELKAI